MKYLFKYRNKRFSCIKISLKINQQTMKELHSIGLPLKK